MFERKIKLVTEGLFDRYFYQNYNQNKCSCYCRLYHVFKHRINPTANHRMAAIEALRMVSRHHYIDKSFKDMTREDVISFLDSVHKPEASDLLHK
jgi:hypothetical protein